MTSTPNPCSPLSRIQVVLPAAGRAQLSVYNTAGKLVRTVSDGRLESGVHAFTWRGDDELNRPVSAGLYVYRLTVGKRTLIHKTVLAK